MNDKPEYRNYPLEEIQEACLAQIAKGNTIYQKFTCAGCGERLIMEPENILYTEGACEKCGAITDIRKDGCNYLMISNGVPEE